MSLAERVEAYAERLAVHRLVSGHTDPSWCGCPVAHAGLHDGANPVPA